jgi:BASS family bile acid:Na+ symporter
MYLMDTLTRTLFYVFLVTSMLGLGMKVRKDEILAVFRTKGWLVRSLVANFIIIPALGVLAARTIPMKPENALALILLACAPGGLSALQFLTKAKDEKTLAHAGATAFLFTFLSIFISPALIAVSLPQRMPIATPYGGAILLLAVFMLLPLVLGTLIHDMAEATSRKLAGPIALIGTLAFVGVIIKTQALSKLAKAEVGKPALAGIIVFILLSMLIGWILGGPRRETRPLLATASSMRNAALGLAIAVRSFPDSGAVTPLVAFVSLMIPANLLLTLLSQMAAKRRAKKAAMKSA